AGNGAPAPRRVARTRLVTTTADVVGRPPSADDALVRAYRERTPGSAASFEAARRVLPGGETRAVTSYPPYPLIITEGHGARLTGRRRLFMFDGAYHGSATPFLPGSPDVVRVPWNDLDAVAALLGRPDHDVAAVFAEPFLGAGGVRPAAPGFLAGVAGLAREH